MILEEIGMRDDTPDDLVHELFEQAMFPEHPLGREVLGSEATIKAMSRERIAEYHGAHYQPSNIVFAAAGNLDHDDVLARARARFPADTGARPARARPDLRAPEPLVVVTPARPNRTTSSSACARCRRSTPTGTRSAC